MLLLDVVSSSAAEEKLDTSSVNVNVMVTAEDDVWLDDVDEIATIGTV